MNTTKHQETNICNLHNVKMKKAIVSTSFGLYVGGYNSEFFNAKRKANMGCMVQPWPKYRLAIIYHCRSCNKIKKENKGKENDDISFVRLENTDGKFLIVLKE